MEVVEKIRVLREINQWSQEDMAEKMDISTNAYARMERGETKLNLEKLDKIATIFNIDIVELLSVSDKGLFLLINENGNNNNANYYGGNNNHELLIENEKLKLINDNYEKLISQQASEIDTLKAMIALLQKRADKD
ncbi:MAG: helix-turn-helix transcriptional regulator [Moraxella sp.]|nr:helix-turn-helix transcriptional regulator [Moraxella sp.]